MKIAIKYIFAVMVVLGGAVACQTSTIEPEIIPEKPTTGELMSVRLDLSLADMITPPGDGTVASKSTRADGSRVLSSQRTSNMLVELVETPEPASRAATISEAIANYWVFVFNGNSDASKLEYKTYQSSYTAGDKYELPVGRAKFVVVVANVGSDFASTLTVGTSTYADLLALNWAVSNEASLFKDKNAILYGATLNSNLVIGAPPIPISLVRNVALVEVRIKLGTGIHKLDMSACDVSFHNVASATYPLTTGRFAPFPSQATIKYNPVKLWPNTSDFVSYSVYLPFNSRPTVKGTTAATRRENAPEGATYIKISGYTGSGKIMTYIVYVGFDLTTSYLIFENTKYIYELTLYDDVEQEDPNAQQDYYLGMFGGKLIKNGNSWAYDKELHILQTNAPDDMLWVPSSYPAMATGITNLKDGRANTWELDKLFKSLGKNPASYCIEQNLSLSEIRNATTAANAVNIHDYQYYLPALNQLLSMFIGINGMTEYENPLAIGQFPTYWSSTEKDASTAYAMYLPRDNPFDHQVYFYPKSIIRSVRCVREIRPTL